MRRGERGAILSWSGVDVPTQVASHQWVLGIPLTLRLYLVSPPDPHSIESPSDWSLLNSSWRVALTALASLSGALACAMIFFSTSGFFARKSLRSLVPLALLHFSQARQRFAILLVPPLARGTMCSTCSGRFCFWQ